TRLPFHPDELAQIRPSPHEMELGDCPFKRVSDKGEFEILGPDPGPNLPLYVPGEKVLQTSGLVPVVILVNKTHPQINSAPRSWPQDVFNGATTGPRDMDKD